MRFRVSTITVLGIFYFAASAAAASGAGDRIKLACPAGAAASHPCRAVYYWGGDGKRHAFPNEQIYFSWYADFNGVKTVDATTMASLMLGTNVTYKPGAKMVKITSDPKTYAVDAGGTLRWVTTEAAAIALYGNSWNSKIDDISDAFFTDYKVGADISSKTDFDPADRTAAATNIDADGGLSYSLRRVTTAVGDFDAQIITIARERFRMKTLVAATTDCSNGCPAKSLLDYAKGTGAGIGIHGTYFCPPDYADCAAKTYSFLWPVYDSATGQMRNASSIPLHHGPMLASAMDGKAYFYRKAPDFVSTDFFQQSHGSPVTAAMANYPALLDGGQVVVASEPMLDDGQRNTKATRGGIGINGNSYFLVIAKNATVIDLAYVMTALGATDAMNLDGGGSSALLYGGAYKTGPGRLLPNAIVFTRN